MRRVQMVVSAMALAATMATGCAWPSTRMVPAADYGSADRVTVSAAPSYRAGPDYVRTASPDGSTAFACVEGGHLPANFVPLGQTPAC